MRLLLIGSMLLTSARCGGDGGPAHVVRDVPVDVADGADGAPLDAVVFDTRVESDMVEADLVETTVAETGEDTIASEDAAVELVEDVAHDTREADGGASADLPGDDDGDTIGEHDAETIGEHDTIEEHDTGDVADTISADASQPPAFSVPRTPRWRLVWSDEFDGRPCDPDEPESCATPEDLDRARYCFGSAAAPVETTLIQRFHSHESDATSYSRRVIPHLEDLDKCTWLVSEHVNLIHFVGPAGPITAYHPDTVSVARGELRLSTRRVPGVDTAALDCGRILDPSLADSAESNRSKTCEYQAANVITYPMNGPARADDALGPATGNGRLFSDGGRLEVRARAAGGPGNMTALWTWQHAAYESEYDLLEQWANWPEMSSHGIVEWEGDDHGGTQARHVMSAAHAQSLYDEFHTYAMEWRERDAFSYLLDHRRLHTFHEGDAAPGKDRCVDISIAGNPFYFILWDLLIEYDWAPEVGPLGPEQAPDTVYVDWIRYYQPCPDDSDDPACVESTLSPACENPCARFGAFDGANCYVGQPPPGSTAAVSATHFGYVPDGSGDCPYGGEPHQGVCALGEVPRGREPFVWDGHWYLKATCSPTAELPNCGRPCPWRGSTYRNGACHVADAAPGATPFVYDNRFYYESAPEPERCPDGGDFDGAHCLLGPAPEGATALVIDGAFYFAVDRCPDGGVFVPERGACRVFDLPLGSGAFVAAGHYYYDAIGGACPHGGTLQGPNCHLGAAPLTAEPFSADGDLYLAARCLPATDWHAAPAPAGAVSIIGGTCP